MPAPSAETTERSGSSMPSASQVFDEVLRTRPPSRPRRLMGRAVVLGGSLAGLLAARVLAEHADEVLLVERDHPAGPAARPGVPQGEQFHGLLPAGRELLELWFPGLTDALVDAGAVLPGPDRVRQYIDGVLRPSPPPLPGAGPVPIVTRPLLESAVRARVVALAPVRVVAGRATGLLVTSGRVTGARYAPAGGDEPVAIAADLVVDATGRASRAGDWLGEHGIPTPALRRMPIQLHYATALFRRDPAITPVEVLTSQALPGPGRTARIGGIGAVEGDRWQVLVAGYGDDRPGRDPIEFAERCRRDFPPEFGLIVDRAERLGDVVTYHQADSRRRDYHAMARPPAGFVAAGDAVASFNPVYGQGMASAALHAACLSRYLREDPRLSEPARGYLDRVEVVVDAVWQISTTADLALPHVDGPYPPGYRMIAALAGSVLAAAFHDDEVNRRLAMVATLLAHPGSLARPSTLARVAAVRLRSASRRRVTA